jgi:hypothetical protein
MVRGCGTGVSQGKQRGLHQTRLRGRPRRRCRRLDCGEGWSRCRHGSSSRPRNSAVPRHRPVRGFKMTGSSSSRRRAPCGAGDASRGVLVMARLEARAAVAQDPPVRHVRRRATVRGPTKRKGVGRGDAWRVAGSTVTAGGHSSAQSVVALSRRLGRVRPWSPQLGAQLPGPGLIQRVLLESSAVNSPSICSPPRLPQPRLGSRGGEKMRQARAASVAASTAEEAGFVEDLSGSQQVIDGPP